MHIAMNDGRIVDPVVLVIDPMVIFWETTQFSNKNAAANDVEIGGTLEDFKKLHFDIFKKRLFDLKEDIRPYYQAEVLVKNYIPLAFIKNIDITDAIDFSFNDILEEEDTDKVEEEPQEKESKLPELDKTEEKTYRLFKQGFNLEEIASKRGFVKSTIVGHCTSLVKKGYINDEDIIGEEVSRTIKDYLRTIDFENTSLRDIFEHFDERFGYDELRIARTGLLREIENNVES